MSIKFEKQTGFTIVELLIVVVVIAILATISVVAYRGIQERAAASSVDSALAQATKKLAMHKVEHDSYPDSLNDIGITSGAGTTYDYSKSASNYCLSATTNNITRVVAQANMPPSSGDCKIALVNWTYSGGVTYDSVNNQINMSPTSSGMARSPLIESNNKTIARIVVDTYATLPSPSSTPNASILFSSYYYGEDKVTPVTNTTGHTTNGSASCSFPVLTWKTCSWGPATGPNVKWVRFSINSAPTQYTSDNSIKNVQISTE